MKQKHSALHTARGAGLLQGLPHLGVQRVQRKDGAKECPRGNIWSSQIQWAIQGLGQAEHCGGLMLGCRKIKGGAGPGRMCFVPACDSLPGQRLGHALHPVLDGVNCRKQPCRRQSPSLSPNPGHPSCPHPPAFPGPVLSAQSKSCGRARKRRFFPQVALSLFNVP